MTVNCDAEQADPVRLSVHRQEKTLYVDTDRIHLELLSCCLFDLMALGLRSMAEPISKVKSLCAAEFRGTMTE